MSERSRPLWTAGLIAVFVIGLRLPYFGNPAINIDEQYYLVFADKWLNGGLIPYVDIWDRKPIGIYLLYGPAVLLFRNGVIGYQLTALAFVLATCAVVYRLARRLGDETFALAAALIYATCPTLMDGGGGQTPVFYNLFTAAAALLIVGLFRDGGMAPVRKHAAIGRLLTASLLFGLALQVKYICVLEAATLCLIGLVYLWHARILRPRGVVGLAAAMMAAGMAPTAASALAFLLSGHWHAFWYANFVSIFQKHIWRLTSATYFWRLFTASLFAIAYLPLAAWALVDALPRRKTMTAVAAWTMAALGAWAAVAFIGGLLLGNPTSHYFLPSAPPLAVLAAAGLRRVGAWLGKTVPRLAPVSETYRMRMLAAALLALPTVACFVIARNREDTRGVPAQVYEIAAAARDGSHGGCLYVFDYLPVLYYLTESCIPTRFAFPNHLNEGSEMHSLEVDSLSELGRIMRARPSMIFVRHPFSAALDPAAIDLFEKALAADYALYAHFNDRAGWQSFNLYVPADQAPAAAKRYPVP